MLKRFMPVLLLTLFATVPATGLGMGVVDVLYAGSLVTQMEGPVKDSLRSSGIEFQGEPGGSKALANLIASGDKSPDVFISVNPSLVTGLRDKVRTASTFASTSLGLGWTGKSKYASLLAGVAAGKTPVSDALATPGLRIGRTDPAVDPKGAFTVEAMKLIGTDANAGEVFPEEVLLTRLDAGEIDVGFFYRTEATARGLHFVALPGKASLSEKITYTIAVMKAAPHPDEAKAFADFIVSGAGRAILQKAGLHYLSTPKVVVP